MFSLCGGRVELDLAVSAVTLSYQCYHEGNACFAGDQLLVPRIMMISTGVGTSNGVITSAAVPLPYHESPRWLPPLVLRSSSPSSNTASVLCNVAAVILSVGGVVGGPLLLCENAGLATAR